MDDAPIEVNAPFKRLPKCACDSGEGDGPTKLKMLECKMRGGACRESDEPQIPEI